ncbi:MAG: L,D-transpeptidase family protein [Bacteroidota bacterium]
MLPIIPLIALAILAGYYFYTPAKLPAGTVIDKLVVYKAKRKMEAWSNGRLIKTYTIALGKNPVGHKEYEGDFRTPEGVYTINARNANSAYHKNLGVSYPNTADVAHAATLRKPPGGDIKIHGLRNGRSYIGKFHCWKDWTHGCIAVTNSEMDELFMAVKENAVIDIRP